MAYLTTALLTARVGGDARYLELTNDVGGPSPDPAIEEFLLAQVDAVVDSFARRYGYTVPLAVTDVEPIIPWLLDIANLKALTRGGRVASADDRKQYDDAMAVMDDIGTGVYKLPSYQTTTTIADFGLDSDGRLYSRRLLRGF